MSQLPPVAKQPHEQHCAKLLFARKRPREAPEPNEPLA